MRRAGSSPRSSPHTMVRAHTLVTCASLRRMLKPDRLTAPPAGSGVRVRAQCRAGTQAHRLQAQGLVRAAAWARLPGSVCAQRAARSCAGAWNTVCLFHDVAVENMPTCHSRHGWKDRLPVLHPQHMFAWDCRDVAFAGYLTGLLDRKPVIVAGTRLVQSTSEESVMQRPSYVCQLSRRPRAAVCPLAQTDCSHELATWRSWLSCTVCVSRACSASGPEHSRCVSPYLISSEALCGRQVT